MSFFIAINGRVYRDTPSNRDLPRLDIENNHFEDREEAYMVAFELEEETPCIFYGKPISKDGLRQYASGDTTAAYRKRS